MKDLDRIHEKLDKIIDSVGDHRERIARIETTQKGFISIFAVLWTALAGFILNKLGIK